MVACKLGLCAPGEAAFQGLMHSHPQRQHTDGLSPQRHHHLLSAPSALGSQPLRPLLLSLHDRARSLRLPVVNPAGRPCQPSTYVAHTAHALLLAASHCSALLLSRDSMAPSFRLLVLLKYQCSTLTMCMHCLYAGAISETVRHFAEVMSVQ